MQSPTQHAFETGARFWGKTEPRVVGDFIGRQTAIDLLPPLTGKTVLEAGCGTGYVARMLRNRGARVLGCDIAEEMLRIARAEELRDPIGIRYVRCDIRKLAFRATSIDHVLCISVLMYLPKLGDIRVFFWEARRVLRPGGHLVISVMHPDLFERNSPARTDQARWLCLTPLGPARPDHAPRFWQEYVDVSGQVFSSQVYAHSLQNFEQALDEAGFRILRTKAPAISREVLSHSSYWTGGPSDYPCYLQILAQIREIA